MVADEKEIWGRYVAAVRKQHNLSQEELAEQIGTNQVTVSRWERRLYKPTFRMQKEIASRYGEPSISSDSGNLETVYEISLLIELRSLGLTSDSQVPIIVQYTGTVVGEHFADLVVVEKVVLELKTVDELTNVHRAQVLNYLRATGMPIGLLVNFKGKKATIRRLTFDNADDHN